MPSHVIVDGSNLATEGRTLPSLKQLHEAIESYRSDHPDVLMTVVVDATFGHRIDPKEVPAFENEIETNAFVAPPAGAVGRGDGFILSIAQKANASILSNDSYQEFHGEYAWLFDEGRLIGGKPVPHVGWVWVNRVPVRGPVSRRSVKEQKIVDKSPSRRRSSKSADLPAISADAPMPVPTAAPPGAVMPGQKPRQARGGDAVEAAAVAAPGTARRGDSRKNEQRNSDTSKPDPVRADQSRPDQGRHDQGKPDASKTTNDLLTFLSFVEHFPVGTAVTGVVETYSSHGAYVLIGDAHGYVPLRLMADPAPRSAREVMDLGETVTLVVSSFGAARRSIDLAVPSMAPAAAPAAPAKPRRGASKKAVALAESAAVAAEALHAASIELAPAASAAETRPKRRPSKKAASTAAAEQPSTAATDVVAVAPIAPARAADAPPTRGASSPRKSSRRPAKAAASSANAEPSGPVDSTPTGSVPTAVTRAAKAAPRAPRQPKPSTGAPTPVPAAVPADPTSPPKQPSPQKQPSQQPSKPSPKQPSATKSSPKRSSPRRRPPNATEPT